MTPQRLSKLGDIDEKAKLADASASARQGTWVAKHGLAISQRDLCRRSQGSARILRAVSGILPGTSFRVWPRDVEALKTLGGKADAVGLPT